MNQEAMNRLRQPHPAQKSVDARSAALLQRSSRYSGRAKDGTNKGLSLWLAPKQAARQKSGLSPTNN